MRYIMWFSCGAASAVATKLLLDMYGDRDDLTIDIAYCDTGSEHEDNKRFLCDVEQWLNIEIQVLKADKYEDIWDLFSSRRILNTRYGAPCTTHFKKAVREAFANTGDINVFGYTIEELARIKKFKYHNPGYPIYCPLIDNHLTHADCLSMIQATGIELPVMYKLGYHHNNCIGCVKGAAGYWNKIRVDFPETFEKAAFLERQFNFHILKDMGFLDELSSTRGNYKNEHMSCGLICQNLIDDWKPKD